jgi:hypothetical protein
MSQDQLISLVALLLALVLAVMRLRGELAARRGSNQQRQQQNRTSTPQPPVTPPDDVERLR